MEIIKDTELVQSISELMDKQTKCEILGHRPSPKLGFNGRASFSVCKQCNKSIENSGEGWVESI
jgi:hypothetical protein